MLCEAESFPIHQRSSPRSSFHLTAFFYPLISHCVNCTSGGSEGKQRDQKGSDRERWSWLCVTALCSRTLGISHCETRKASTAPVDNWFWSKGPIKGRMSPERKCFLWPPNFFVFCALVLKWQHLTAINVLLGRTWHPVKYQQCKRRMDVMSHSGWATWLFQEQDFSERLRLLAGK